MAYTFKEVFKNIGTLWKNSPNEINEFLNNLPLGERRASVYELLTTSFKEEHAHATLIYLLKNFSSTLPMASVILLDIQLILMYKKVTVLVTKSEGPDWYKQSQTKGIYTAFRDDFKFIN